MKLEDLISGKTILVDPENDIEGIKTAWPILVDDHYEMLTVFHIGHLTNRRVWRRAIGRKWRIYVTFQKK